MKLIIIILSFFTTACNSLSKSIKVSDKSKIYVYDIAPKVYGQTTICFLIVDEGVVLREISYKVYSSEKKGIEKIKNEEIFIHKQYTIGTDGNISIIGSKIKGYTEKSFLAHKYNSDKFYQVLSLDFLKLSNTQKIHLLEQLKSK